MTLTVKSIHIYPVKSLGGISLDSSDCLETGLLHDRHWMLVDENMQFVTQRQIPAMAAVKLTLSGNLLTFHHSDNGNCSLDLTSVNSDTHQVTVWKDTLNGHLINDEINAWLNDTLGPYKKGPLRLVEFSSTQRRKVATKYLEKQDADVQYADACPYLLSFSESLSSLNQKLPSAIEMSRFRANVEFSGAEAWAEYNWQSIYNDKVNFSLIGPCQRCQMTTIDQDKGVIASPGEPIQTLIKEFPAKNDNMPYFGQHARLLNNEPGHISVGDEFEVIPLG